MTEKPIDPYWWCDSFQPDPYRAVAVRLARAEEELERLKRGAE